MVHGALHDLVEVGVHEGLAAGQREDQVSELREVIDPLEEDLLGHRVRVVVVLVAVAAAEVAAPDDHQLRQHGGLLACHRQRAPTDRAERVRREPVEERAGEGAAVELVGVEHGIAIRSGAEKGS